MKLRFINLFLQCMLLLISQDLFCDTEVIFTHIYHTNFWGDPDSHSGSGSNLVQTKIIRQELPKLFRKYDIESILDAPCGDFYWMKEVDLSMLKYYIGIDIVQEIIQYNKKTFENSTRKFFYKNIITDSLPKADLIFCRDCMMHLTNQNIRQVLKNFKSSGAKYLLVGHFFALTANSDLPQDGL